jgi:hypothetical protein
MSNLIEDETETSYVIRTDKMKEGDSLECRDDHDMMIKKEGKSILLTKKCFFKNCFSKEAK